MTDVRYYSMRRLSPYQGTIQVVELPGFRAMSPDGITWQVQIQNQGARYATYGVWRDDGSGDLAATARTEAFVAAMSGHPPLPFPLADTLELWLLGSGDRRPLAILASTLDHKTPPRALDSVWRAAFDEDNSFVAPSLHGAGASAPNIPHRELLNRCVRKATGMAPRAQWFRRAPEGTGVGLGGLRLEEALVGRELGPAEFPELLLREEWGSDVEARLVRDYHDWQAANLLTHSRLRHATRDRLERAACRQAEKLYKIRQLLPEIVNADLVKVALVEAVLRRSAHPVAV
jgi:hypothetical protein